MKIRADTIQQRSKEDGHTLVSLPVLYVDGMLTTIDGAPQFATHQEALDYATGCALAANSDTPEGET